MITLYSRPEVCAKLDIGKNTLATWVAQGYVVPTIPSGVQGKKDYYDTECLTKIALLKRLVEAGILRGLAKRMIANVDPIAEHTKEGLKFKFCLTVTVPNY